MDSDRPQVAVWCHICSTSTQANLNELTNEYECTVCQSDCVEKLNQGIEEFQGRSAVSNEEPSTTGSENAMNDLVQQVMDRILGIDSGASGYQTGGSFQQRMVNGRPIGVMVQPIQSNARLVRLGDASGVSMVDIGGQAHQSVFGLLSSLSSMRGRSSMFASSSRLGVSDFVSDDMTSSQWEDFLHHLLMNESSRAGAPPASKHLLDNLPRQTVAGDSEVLALGECCITQEAFEVGEVMVPLRCGHNYKQEPIMQWLAMHNTCPVCRVEVTAES